MSAELGYDTTNLRALQEELRRLNAAAQAEGLLDDLAMPRAAPAKSAPAKSAPAKSSPAKSAPIKTALPLAARRAAPNRGKGAARRVLEMCGRLDDDDSPDVPGTQFTEAGVVRLLAYMRRRRGGAGPWPRFLARAERALARPVPLGQHVVAGIGLVRLQMVCRQLLEIEAHGLAHLMARRAIRRGRIAEAGALMLGRGSPTSSHPGGSR